jgi:hypothetical protein
MRILIPLLSFFLTTELLAQDNQTRWLTFHDIELNAFKKSNTKELNFALEAEFDSTAKELKLYQPFFIKSPNQSKLVDLDSYKLLLEEENGKIITYGGSLDTEILLVDLNMNKQKRIAFYGSAVIVEDAYWVNENLLRIFQIDVGESDFRLEYMEYDLEQLTKTLWTSDRTFLSYLDSYNEQVRLTSVNFK